MKFSTVLVSTCLALSAPTLVCAQEAFQAELVNHAVLPAQTMIAAPKDAPSNLQTSGKFTTGSYTMTRALQAILTLDQFAFYT